MKMISRKFKKSDICQLGTQKKTLTFSNKKSVSLKLYKQNKKCYFKNNAKKQKTKTI